MCSELDHGKVSTVTDSRPVLSEERHTTSEQDTNDTLSESEDDDIGSEELMCNENIDVNDKESDESDEEELTNRVFPQQKFSPVPFTVRRSQTPDLGKIRYSPIAFPAKRAVTPNMYEQMLGKVHSREQTDSTCGPLSKMVDFGFRAPKGLPFLSKGNSSDKVDRAVSLGGQFVRPKLPTTKNNSPGLTVSGYFQPTGSVFRPSQPSSSSTTLHSSPGSDSSLKTVLSSSASSQSAPFSSYVTKPLPGVTVSARGNPTDYPAMAFQVKPNSPSYKAGSHGRSAVSSSQFGEDTPVSRFPFQHQSVASTPSGPLSTVRTPQVVSSVSTASAVGQQPSWSLGSMLASMAPLTVSVASHNIPPFHQAVKATPVLSLSTKGMQQKPIAPLLSPPLMAASPTGDKSAGRVLLAKKPAPLSGLVMGHSNVKQGPFSPGGVGYYNVNPASLGVHQGIVPAPLHSPGKPVNQGPSIRPPPVSPKPTTQPVSPRFAASNTSQLSPKGVEILAKPSYPNENHAAPTSSPKTLPSSDGDLTGAINTNRQTIKAEQPSQNQTMDAQTTQSCLEESASKGQVYGKPILKRFIPDGMEE